MTALPAYVLLTLGAYAFLRRCIGLSDVALLGLLVLVALTYACYLYTQTAQSASGVERGNRTLAPRAAVRPDAITVPTPPATLGQTVLPSQPPTSRGRGTIQPPSAFERAVTAYPDLRMAWRRLGRLYKQEGPVPLSQRSALQMAHDAFVNHVRALQRLARVSEERTRGGHHYMDNNGTPARPRPLVLDPRRRLAAPTPRQRHPSRPLSEAQRRAAVVTTYARLQDALDGLRLQVLPMTKDARRAEAAMEQICTTLEAVDTGDVYSARVPAPVNGRT